MNIRVEISVIIPCYNQGEFLNEAIQSVLKSDYEDYEIIIVNDGSTDALSLEVFKELEQEFKNNQRVKIIHQDNLGLSTARNNGIRASSGEYILPLDADNKIRPYYMSSAIKILDNNPKFGVVYSYANFFGEKEGIWEFPAFDSQRLLLGNFVEACSIFRKRVWEECGGYDQQMRIGYEDWDLWIGALERGWKFYLIKEVLFDYRVRSDSMIAACSIPENRRYLIRYICNKHRDTYIKNMAYVISEKDVMYLNLANYANDLESAMRHKDAHIRDLDMHIKNLEVIVKEKDELINAMRATKGWRMLERFRRIRVMLSSK